MLTELQIRNFAIIDDLSISFTPGLTILSGETGAGKSIIIGALNLLLGGRAGVDLIRTGEEEATVEAAFELSACGTMQVRLAAAGLNSDATTLVIKRVLSREGRNKVILNGSLATLSMLIDLSESLLAISGQHEHQALLQPQNHIDLLDNYGDLAGLRNEYRTSYQEAQQLQAEKSRLSSAKERDAERVELLRFQSREIEETCLRPGEDEALGKERNLLQNAAQLLHASQQAYEALYGSDEAIVARLGRELKTLSETAEIDATLAPHAQTVQATMLQLEDVAFGLRQYAQKINFDPTRLEEIDARLDTIHRLKKKYGGSIPAILEFHDKAKAEITQLTQREDLIQRTQALYDNARAKMAARAAVLSQRRKEVAGLLRTKLEQELASLGMKHTRFEAALRSSETLDEKGGDQVEFLVSPNPGEDLRPLARIASGGELSRVMLAFKHLLAQEEEIATLIFDEVDSGIGGATADIVGRKLFEIAKYHQTICITHLPQIACYGDRHFSISKEVTGGRTKTKVEPLSAEGRVEEIARMLAGSEISAKTRTLAREMIEASRKIKAEGRPKA